MSGSDTSFRFEGGNECPVRVTEVQNLVTNEHIISVAHIGKSMPSQPVDQFGDDWFTVELPNVSCGPGAHLMVELKENKVDGLYLQGTAKVEKKAPIEDGLALVTLKLVQFDIDVWQEMIKLFELRQKMAGQLFEAMKK